MTSKDKDVLEHIIKYCSRINEDVERFGDKFEIFEADKAFKDSVSMNILQIGELSKALSEEFKESTNQEVNWRQIYGMRNHFAHGYGSMDILIIWEVAVSDIPKLLSFCEKCLEASEQE